MAATIILPLTAGTALFAAMPTAKTGLDVLMADDFAPLRGLRVGVVTHPAAVDRELRHIIELLAAAPKVELASIFGPEHGLLGPAQDLIAVSAAESKQANMPQVHSLYGPTAESLRSTDSQLKGLDVVVIDMQDIGSRYYTFHATMRYCLQAALPLGLRVLVLEAKAAGRRGRSRLPARHGWMPRSSRAP